MRKALLALLLLAGCATPTGTPAPRCDGSWALAEPLIVTPEADASPEPVPVRCIGEIGARRVRIGFDMPAGPTCRVLHEVRVVEDADAVSIALFLAPTDDPAAGACPDEPRRVVTEVDLQAPVQGRALLDGFVGAPSASASTMQP